MRVIFSLLLFSLSLCADKLSWSSDYNNTMTTAQEHNKTVFMMYSAPWCPECNYMKEVIFQDPKVNAYMKSHFELLSLDIQKDTLPKGFPYIGIPTYYIINPTDHKMIQKIEGGSKASVFLQKLQNKTR